MLHSLSERQQICLQNKSLTLHPLEFILGFLVGGRAFNLKVATIHSFPLLQQQADSKDSYKDRGDACIPWISAAFQLQSWCLQIKWWNDCCDQQFPGFETPWLWVTQQRTSSTPPPISRNSWRTDVSDLDSNGGGKKCTLFHPWPVFMPVLSLHTEWEDLGYIDC